MNRRTSMNVREYTELYHRNEPSFTQKFLCASASLFIVTTVVIFVVHLIIS